MDFLSYKPIGTIHSPFNKSKDMPIQPSGAMGVKGFVELKEEFSQGLQDLDGFSHIILIYHFHQVKDYALRVMPFLDKKKRGIFATRAPKRPNPIGLSVVKLINIEGHKLYIENIDVIDGTPLLDIKPFVPLFDVPEVERIGWLADHQDQVSSARADERFD